MKTSLILALTPHPYLALHFRDNLDNFIDEVDEMFIGIEGEDTKFNKRIKKFIQGLFKHKKIKCFIYNEPLDQGAVFDRLYKHCTGDMLITIDSDYSIRKKGYLKRKIDLIKSEEYDCIGSQGGHIDGSLRPTVHAKMEHGRLNPFLSLWRMDILKQIKDLTFKGKELKKGDFLFPKAGVVAPADGYVDPSVLAFLCYSEYTTRWLITKDDESAPDAFHYGGVSWIYRYYFIHTKKHVSPDGTKINRNKLKMRIYYLACQIALFEKYKDRLPYKEYNKFVSEIVERHKKLCDNKLLDTYIECFEGILE